MPSNQEVYDFIALAFSFICFLMIVGHIMGCILEHAIERASKWWGSL